MWPAKRVNLGMLFTLDAASLGRGGLLFRSKLCYSSRMAVENRLREAPQNLVGKIAEVVETPANVRELY